MVVRRHQNAKRILTGYPILDFRLGQFKKVGTSNRIARSAISAAARVTLKHIKKEVPSQYKGIRKNGFGWRIVKTKIGAHAKVGAGIGKRRPPPSRDPKRPGVGIGERNIHWWVMGTQSRFTKAGKYRGDMPSNPVVKTGAAKSRAELVRVMRKSLAKGLARETKKILMKKFA